MATFNRAQLVGRAIASGGSSLTATARNGLQQSHGEPNRLLLLGLDMLGAADLPVSLPARAAR
jgi:hypothetical protein